MPQFVRTLYHANFAEDQDIGSEPVIARCLVQCAQNPAARIDAAQTPPLKDRLREQTGEAAALGLFGAPSFRVGDELPALAKAPIDRVQLSRQRPEVRLVSAVLQVAGDLRLLGLGSAAPHGSTPSHRIRGSPKAGPDDVRHLSWVLRYMDEGAFGTSGCV